MASTINPSTPKFEQTVGTWTCLCFDAVVGIQQVTKISQKNNYLKSLCSGQLLMVWKTTTPPTIYHRTTNKRWLQWLQRGSSEKRWWIRHLLWYDWNFTVQGHEHHEHRMGWTVWKGTMGVSGCQEEGSINEGWWEINRRRKEKGGEEWRKRGARN